MSMSRRKIAVLGGDKRQPAAARYLAKDPNLAVTVWGLPRDAEIGNAVWAADWKNAIESAEAILLPLPMTHDGVRINCALLEQSLPPGQGPDLRFTHLLDVMHREQIIFGGRIPPACKTYAEEQGYSITDYSEDDLFQIRNARPTAEGALEIALHELPVILCGIHAAVIGYGRIAQILASLLRAVGAEVTIAARKPADLCRAEALGYSTLRILREEGKSSLTRLGKKHRVIFNTVPYWLFDRTVLEELSDDVLLIDLASAPGGIDPQAAIDCGTRVIRAPGLPGKCASVTAGEIIAQSVMGHLYEKGGVLP